MKVECSQCGHLGPAAEVRHGDDGVEVVCEECGAANPLEGAGAGDDGDDLSAEADADTSDGTTDASAAVDEADDPAEDAKQAVLEADGPTEAALEAAALAGGTADDSDPDPTEYGSRDLTLEKDQALDRLVPEQGPGIRCPKCAKLQRADTENCKRCGLNLDEARHYDDGEAPWEQPPPGKDAEYERADLLWGVYQESGDTEDLRDFVDFVNEHMLYEMAIRRLQFRLVDHPDDGDAHEALGELASGVQSQIAAARAKAEADAEDLNEGIKQFKRRVAAGIIIVGAVVLLVIANIVW